MALMRPGQTDIVTYARDGTGPRHMQQLGYINSLQYSFTNPGGPDQLSFNFERDGRLRTDALNPARIIRAIRGASTVWEGEIDEPDFQANAASGGGAQVTAHGAGTFGADLMAYYTGAWSGNPDAAVNNAISRGMRWVNPGLNGVSGIYLGQRVDPAAQSITALMNLTTTKGGLTWYVTTRPRGNVVSIYPLPTTPTRLLIATSPVTRTLYGYINRLYIRYQQGAPLGKPPVFDTITRELADSVNKHGPKEAYLDLTSSGFQPLVGPVQAVGDAVLKRYQQLQWGGAFNVQHGELLTMGGTPVDLGMQECATMVCRLLMADYSQGGQVSANPITFLVGSYTYFDDTMTAQIVPFQSARSDFQSMLSQIHLRPHQGNKIVTERLHWGNFGHHKHHHHKHHNRH